MECKTNNQDLEVRVKKVLDRIRSAGIAIVDPANRICNLEIREAYLYGLKNGIFNEADAEEAQATYMSGELTRIALNSVSSDNYKERLINRINYGGGWSSDVDARRELERYEERRRNDINEGSW
ncbi:hypothetical protein HZA97_07975 [Candidatus Woesearchaeota archaeon]|nr:hypothetical protein [Candidatus Woesearchaeota archaeon]